MYNHHSSSRYGNSGSSSGSRPTSAPQGALGAWADWAVRNLDPELQISPIQAYVERCCHPSLSQPNLALNLELADYINQKKANTPRDAAFETVRRVNSRNPQVGLLALALLDNLVKNCGYPFHLQVATKEFLNELVKRFPERPSPFPTPVQSKILELIHEWKLTICTSSKHREDLVHIRDMHRLLGYKGYRFPNVDSRSANVMNTESTLKSPEELEEEDRAAQGAKLQELIRRGTPRDLAQAQELMKIMSGAEPENKPDYSQQTRKELDKVQSRAILLNDMLNNAKEGEKLVPGAAYDQISAHLRSVQPRIQKWISEAEEGGGEGEADNMDRLLLINDLINQVCDRYKAFTRGEWDATAHIDPSIDPSRGGADAVPTAKIQDLINFDDEGTQPTPAAAGQNGGSALDDFASLTFDDPPSAAAAQSGNGSSSSSGKAKAVQQQHQETGPGGLPADLFSQTISPTTTGGSGSGGWGALQLPTSTLTTSSAGAGAGASLLDTPSLLPTQAQTSTKTAQPAQQQQRQQASTTAAKADPFADLDAMFK